MKHANWVAALPMYNVTPHLAASWRELLAELERRLCAENGPGSISILSPDDAELAAFWRREDLLLSQTCGYPLMRGIEKHVQLLATPVFDAPGCAGPNYSSVIVGRKNGQEASLESFRGRIAACNDEQSHSGMNAFRHAIAPLAKGGKFFGGILKTGSHLNSLRALAEGRADIAAIDCVTFAFARDHLPQLVEPLRALSYTLSSPGLPLITSKYTDPALLQIVKSALDDIVATRRALARRLRLLEFATLPLNAYRMIMDMEQQAVSSGYAHLA